MPYLTTREWKAEEGFAARYSERITTILGRGQSRWVSLREFDRRWLATQQPGDSVLYAGSASVTELAVALQYVNLIEIDDDKIGRPWRIRACDRRPLDYSTSSRCCLASYCRCRAPQNTHRV